MQSSPNSLTQIDNNEFLYFSGTSYYSLHSEKEMIDASIQAVEKYGLGSAASRATYGNTPLLEKLEQSISNYFKRECSVFLPSGYLSNLAGMKALYSLYGYQQILIDENSHYSVFDGAKAIGVEVIKFNHFDNNDLEDKLKTSSRKTLIVSDGVFPLFGTIAPLDKYVDLLDKYDAMLWIDDAHGVGVLGESGRGTLDHFSISNNNVFFGATLSKAFGAYGGFISGSKDFIDEIKKGEVVNGTNSTPISIMATGIKGIEILKNNPKYRENLLDNASYLKECLGRIGIKSNSIFPIIAFNSIDEDIMREIHNYLLNKNIAIQLLKYSGSDKIVLRIVVFSTHTKKQIDLLVKQLQTAISIYSK